MSTISRSNVYVAPLVATPLVGVASSSESIDFDLPIWMWWALTGLLVFTGMAALVVIAIIHVMDDRAAASVGGSRRGGSAISSSKSHSAGPSGSPPSRNSLRKLTTRSNQQAAARVYIQASKKAGRAVPQRVRDLASGDHK